MKKSYLIYTLWLMLVILWNFLYPEVEPIYDVIAAIILSMIAPIVNRFI
tara:strand:- start:381 stop:527 length:147 start_codon:yes stop_codon:yes gene_type:complete